MELTTDRLKDLKWLKEVLDWFWGNLWFALLLSKEKPRKNGKEKAKKQLVKNTINKN